MESEPQYRPQSHGRAGGQVVGLHPCPPCSGRSHLEHLELRQQRHPLWAFTDTTLTSYSGYHGAILGPWNTIRIIATRSGTSAGKVVLWPTWPWNNAHNFGVWWRAAS